MFQLDAGEQPFGVVAVIGPAGLLHLLGEGRQPMGAEGGARRFEGVSQRRTPSHNPTPPRPGAAA